MSDSTDQNTERSMPVMIHTQYIKDMSFENPLAPNSLRAGKTSPEMDIDISMESNPIEDKEIKNLFEVVLNLSATAKHGDEVAFIAEIAYGVTVSLGDLPEDQHHPFYLSKCRVKPSHLPAKFWAQSHSKADIRHYC